MFRSAAITVDDNQPMAQIVVMPIDFKCTTCQSTLRVPESGGGKRARCPHCKSLNLIPQTKPEEPSRPPASQQFFIDSVSGSTYGPITKLELDQWVQEGRVSGDCAVRASGEKQGQPASRYYPNLQPSPHQPPRTANAEVTLDRHPIEKMEPTVDTGGQSRTPQFAKQIGYSVIPTEVDFELIFHTAVKLFLKNAIILSTTALICILPSAVDSIFRLADNELEAIPQILLNLLQIYLSIGQARLALQICRGQPTTLGAVFSGSDKFLPVILFTFLAYLALALGFLLLVLPAIFLLLFFWPSYFLIVDDKADILDSFFLAKALSAPNVLTTLLLGLTSIGILIAGLLICGVGVIPASGFVSILWVVSYLAMSGQLSFE
ncbi:MAG: hypothetical protein ACPIA2_17060 [Mariniblastus sp.]